VSERQLHTGAKRQARKAQRVRTATSYRRKATSTQGGTAQQASQSRVGHEPATGRSTRGCVPDRQTDMGSRRRVGKTPAATRDFERGPQPQQRRPSTSDTSTRKTRRAIHQKTHRRAPTDTDGRATSRPPRPRGQLSRQRPGAAQQRHRPERRGPSRPRHT